MRFFTLIFCTALALAACESPEPTGLTAANEHVSVRVNAPAALNMELATARAATARYQRVEAALADGFVDIDLFVPGMGYHFLNPDRVDGTFDPREPELLVYTRQSNGRMRLVAVEYAVPTSEPRPEGFTGDTDVWDENTTFSLWTLHAWVWLENPDGVFADLNPRLQ